jgi:membrane protease YdiL (CAAX protease family)
MRTGNTHFKENKGGIPDFVTYPRQFVTYRWYRPLITGVLMAVILLACNFILIKIASAATGSFGSIQDMIKGGYDTMDTYTGPGALLSLGNLALIIPVLALANKLAGRRTFKSYLSSRGGWDFGILFKTLLIGLVLVALPVALDCILYDGRVSENKFTAAGFIVLLLLGPLQCIAEELLLRGFTMQTFGGWTRSAVAAIIIQGILFASLHSYSILGVIEVLIFGIVCGVITWLTKGIEASSVLHICNNMPLFICRGLGYGAITTTVKMRSTVESSIICLIFLAAVMILNKRGMFDRYRENDAAEYNAKVEANLAAQKA